ncbi:hypothetical protein HU200_025152 [Digitaria exilis]|uniref:Reverse transcriptase zinc-binding domain-containing protein n=1 Tax=Digitaria exilis TaxID=1010633 RepID=A0A835BXN1_9POAL|nr:hypothetical protein HU200_025152 [Digitaria exilis]
MDIVRNRFFEGSARFAASRPLWNAWAPLKCTIAYGQPTAGIGMAYRTPRLRETCDHLFQTCYFARQIWSAISVLLQLPDLVNQSSSLTDWWLQLSRRGIDTTVLLMSWIIWKLRNDRVFNSSTVAAAQAIHLIIQEANFLGWPLSTAVVGAA